MLTLLNFSKISLLISLLLYCVSLIVLFRFIKNENTSIRKTVLDHKGYFIVSILAGGRTVMTILNAFLKLSAGEYAKLSVLLSFLMLYGISLFFYYAIKKDYSFEKLFFIQALVFGSVLMMIFPLYGVADEPQHMRTAYYLSNKFLNLDSPSNVVYMRYDDATFDMKYPDYELEDLNDYLVQLNTPLNNSEIILVEDTKDFSQTIEHTRRPIVTKTQLYQYIAPAIGICIGRLFGMNTISTYLMGRFCNLLFYSLIIYFSLKLLPIGKSLLYSISLFPMCLHLASSTSRDAFRISIAALCISLTMKLFFNEEEINKQEKTVLIVLLIISSVLLLPLRTYVYSTVSLLPILIYLYRKKIITQKRILVFSFVCIFLAGLYVIFKTVVYPGNIVVEPEKPLIWTTAPGYTIQSFINHPVYLITMIRNNIIKNGAWYVSHMVGSPLGWLSIYLPDIYILILELNLLLCLFKRSYERISLSPIFRYSLFMLSVLSCLMIFAGMAITWTRAGMTEVEGVQGRYFLPVFFLMLLSFRGDSIKVDHSTDRLCISTQFITTMLIVHYLILLFI